LRTLSTEQLDAIAERYRPLGAFVKVDELQLTRLTAALSLFSNKRLLSYNGRAQFRQGSANVTATLIVRDGQFRVYNLSLSTPQPHRRSTLYNRLRRRSGGMLRWCESGRRRCSTWELPFHTKESKYEAPQRVQGICGQGQRGRYGGWGNYRHRVRQNRQLAGCRCRHAAHRRATGWGRFQNGGGQHLRNSRRRAGGD